jgi:NAD(P)-dependent dehydrogenase (short-subunit alcohol dehydrogenase family)
MNANNNFAHNFSIKKFGSIVNMASIYGILGPDDRIYQDNEIYMPDWYAGAKGAIIAHSRCLATRYAKHNVRINCLALGGVYDNQSEDFVKKYNNKVPLGRMARTSDIVGIVEFLISDRSSYITGQCIPVDGGISITV